MSLIEKFNQWDKAIDSSSQPDWRDEARECFDMVSGHQLKNMSERKEAEDKGILYVFLNKIDPTVSAICGSEITNRQEVRYYPREMTTPGPDGQPQDAKVNEILTAAAEWSRDECDAADEESEAYRDCVTTGMGWTETRMSYDTDPDGMALTERVDPLEMAWDPSSRRPNLADARYLRRKKRFSKAEAAERFGIDPDTFGTGRDSGERWGPHDADPQAAYQGNGEPELRKDEIEIKEYQWYELEPAVRVANPVTGQMENLSPDQWEKLQGLPVQAAPIKLRKYYRAWRIDDQVLDFQPLPEDEFTLKAITGKLDRNKGIWYGVVRAMVDPQRLLNKQASQLQRIVDVTAKGGLLAEVDAFEDEHQAKQDWAASDTIVFTQPGAVSKGRVIPKPIGNYPPAIDKLFATMNEMVPGVSGVNNEMLGVIDREQAGVVDWQRKQAAYGVLAGFFNSLRRYRRMQGRLLLKLITKYMSDDRLIRVTDKGNVRYLPLIRQPETIKYDVVVDEAPQGPNQKERTFLFLMQFGPMLAKLGLPPEIWLKLMEYSPLPLSLVSEIQQIMQQKSQEGPPPDPKMEAVKQKAAADQQKMALDQQNTQAQMIADWQMQQQQMQADQQARADEQYAKMVAAIQESQRKAQEATQKMMLDMHTSIAQMRMDFVLGREKIAADERLGRAKAASNGVDTDVNGA